MSVTIAISEQPPVTIPARATASLASFREWAGGNSLPEKAKLCSYRGEVFVGTGIAEIFSRVLVKTQISRVLANIVKELRSGIFLDVGVILTLEAAVVSNNPDAVFVSNDAIKANRIEFVEGYEGGDVELLGSPDMVQVVVSHSSAKNDNQTGIEACYEAGVSEYWQVDACGEEVEFNPYQHGAKKLTAVKPEHGGWVKSAMFGKSFRLTRGSDAAGKPEFTHEVN